MVEQLRLGFAMGGGVSLGAFSGVALTEAIKLAVAYAPKEKEVVVDVFSGASAGAMSLGLMLRTLAHPDEKEMPRATAHVKAEFGAVFDQLGPKRQRDLAAAHLAQEIQQEVWEQEITLDRLLGNKPETLLHSPGLLDRGAVESIAKKYMKLPEAVDFSNRCVLGERVLFAATLSNLTPLVADGTDNAQNPALTDGMTSRIHRDLRVFDLRFKAVAVDSLDEDDADPPTWCRYHLGGEQKGSLGDLREQKTWAKIAATSIAAGAFPFAFGPVVLNRKSWEFDFGWPASLPKDKDEFPFTYVDGGVFNNEPIREAFRMAAFLDAQELGKAVDVRPTIDRRIVFVDPRIDNPEVSLRMALHADWFLQAPNKFGSFDGLDLEKKTTLERLLPTAVAIASAIYDEASVQEGDKIFDVKALFEHRDEVRKHLDHCLGAPTKEVLDGLRKHCSSVLAENRKRQRIPASGLKLWQELERIVVEQGWEKELGGKAEEFEETGQTTDEHATLWLKALTYLAYDLGAGLAGKRNESGTVAIAPIVGDRIRSLPGGALAGFAGFTSDANAAYESALARYATRQRMIEDGLIAIPDDAVQPPPEMTPEELSKFADDVKRGLSRLGDRMAQVIRGSHAEIVFPGIDRLILALGASALKNATSKAPIDEPVKRRSFEFRIDVPSDSYEFDGKGIGDRDIRPVSIDGRHVLITFASYDEEKQRWVGPHLDPKGVKLSIDRNGVFRDSLALEILMPAVDRIEPAHLNPNPAFACIVTQDGGDYRSTDWKVESGVVSLDERLF
jgi:predicted acylesterase/phospholipase RssA